MMLTIAQLTMIASIVGMCMYLCWDVYLTMIGDKRVEDFHKATWFNCWSNPLFYAGLIPILGWILAMIMAGISHA